MQKTAYEMRISDVSSDVCSSDLAAHQTPFLRHGGEDEVGMPLRQIIQMALRALEEALAENSSGSDGDLRLADVIASAQRIAFRVEEDEDAVLLVIVQEAEGEIGRAHV